MKRTFIILIVALIFILSGCEENRIIDITGNEDLIVYIGSSEELIVSNLSVSGNDSIQNYEISVDLSNVRINIPGTYDVIYFVTLNGTVVHRESGSITVTNIPPTNYPEINYTRNQVYVKSHPIPNYASSVEAIDRKDGDLTEQIEIDDSSVNYNVLGTYDVVYEITNSDQLTTTKTIQVHVVDNTPFSPLPDDFFIVERNGKVGIKSTSNTTIVPFIYDDIVYLNQNMLKLYIEDVSYYYNFSTQQFLTPNYELFAYSNGLAKAKDIIGYYGYVNIEGSVVIPFTYDFASSFQRGLAKVSQNGLYGLIDSTNTIIVPLEYENIQSFNDGYVVEIDDHHMVLSDSGNTLFESDVFDTTPIVIHDAIYYRFMDNGFVGLVNDDFTIFKTADNKEITVLDSMIIFEKQTGRFDFHNLVTNNQVFNVYDFQLEEDYIIYQSEFGSGVLDLNTLEEVLEPDYIFISILNENLFLVRNKEYQYGLKNSSNTTVLPLLYSQFKIMNDYYIVTNDEGMTLLDKDGSIISATYDGIDSFNEGYAVVEKDGLFGLIVEDGTEVLRLTYTKIKPVQNGYIYTYTATSPNQSAWGVLNLNMQIIIPNMYANIGFMKDGLFAVTKDYTDETSSGYINESGSIVLPLDYKETTNLIDGYGIVTLEDNSKKVIDQEGNFIHSSSYYDIDELQDNYFIIQSSDAINSHCLMNTNGEIVTPCIYQDITAFIDGVATITIVEGSNYLTLDGEVLLEQSVSYVDEFTHGMGLLLNKEYKTDIINSSGNYVYQNLFSAKILSDEYIAIKDLNTLKYGIYNIQGEMLVEPMYFTIEPFYEGFSVACIDSHTQCGVLDQELNTRIPFMYDLVEKENETYVFRHQGVFYQLETRDNQLVKSTLTSLNIQYVYHEENDLYIDDVYVGSYQYLDFIENGMYLDVYDEYIGLALKNGRILIDPLYEEFEFQPNRSYQLIRTNGLYGVIDETQTVIISELYHSIKPVSEQYLLVVQGDLHGIFDIEGHMIIPVNYDRILYQTK